MEWTPFVPDVRPRDYSGPSLADGIIVPKAEDARSSRATGGSNLESSGTVVGVDIAKRVFQLRLMETETGELIDLRLTRAKFLEHYSNRALPLAALRAGLLRKASHRKPTV